MTSSTPSSSPTLIKKEILQNNSTTANFLNTPNITPKQNIENNATAGITNSITSELMKSFETYKENDKKGVIDQKDIYNTPNISPPINKTTEKFGSHLPPHLLPHAKNLFITSSQSSNLTEDNTNNKAEKNDTDILVSTPSKNNNTNCTMNTRTADNLITTKQLDITVSEKNQSLPPNTSNTSVGGDTVMKHLIDNENENENENENKNKNENTMGKEMPKAMRTHPSLPNGNEKEIDKNDGKNEREDPMDIDTKNKNTVIKMEIDAPLSPSEKEATPKMEKEIKQEIVSSDRPVNTTINNNSPTLNNSPTNSITNNTNPNNTNHHDDNLSITINSTSITTTPSQHPLTSTSPSGPTTTNTTEKLVHKKWNPKMIHRKRKSFQPVRAIDTSQCISEAEKCIEGIVKIEVYPIIQTHPSYLVHTPKEAEHLSLETPLKLVTSRRHKYHAMSHSNSQSSLSSAYAFSFPRLNSPPPKTYPISRVIRSAVAAHQRHDSPTPRRTSKYRQYDHIGSRSDFPDNPDTYRKMKYINPPPPVTWKKGMPLEIPKDTPLYDLLHKEEIDTCSILRILPSQYLRVRDILIKGYQKNGYYLKKDAKKWCRGIDVNKTAKLYDWWVDIGWLPFKDIIMSEQLEKKSSKQK